LGREREAAGENSADALVGHGRWRETSPAHTVRALGAVIRLGISTQEERGRDGDLT
jgi:hypothetical protein